MEIPETTPTVENDAEEIRPTENESVSEGEDLTAELDDEPVDSFIDLPRGQALTTSEASQISSAKRSQLIVIAGEVKSGKTTLLTSLFHCFQKGPKAELETNMKTISEKFETEVNVAAEAIVDSLTKVQNGLNKCIEHSNQISQQQKLHREESDVLWWIMGEYSRDHDKPICEIKIPELYILVGKELADLISIIPGPFSAQAYLNKMLKLSSVDFSKPIKISDAVNKADKKWRQQWSKKLSDFDGLDL